MSINRFFNLTKKLALVSASSFVAYKVICDKLFDLAFKKNDEEYKLEEKHIDWLSSSISSDVYINSFDGLKLHGLKIENHITSKYVIMVHGIWSNLRWLIPYAYEFDKLGYNVLLIDQRASGLSQGNYYTYGYKESIDLIDWTNYLINCNSQIQITYFGVSMGAATVMLTTNKDIPSNVKCIIEDCGYADTKEELAHIIKTKYKINKPNLVLNLFEKKMHDKFGFIYSDVSPKIALNKNNLPLLIIHGDADNFVPYNMSKIIYNNQLGYKKFYCVKNAKHAQCHLDKNYFLIVDDFIKKFVQ